MVEGERIVEGAVEVEAMEVRPGGEAEAEEEDGEAALAYDITGAFRRPDLAPP